MSEEDYGYSNSGKYGGEISTPDNPTFSTDTFSTTSDPPTDPRLLDLIQYVNTVKSFAPDIEIPQPTDNSLNITMPSSILPLTIRVAYGFEDCDTLLTIALNLDEYNWRKKPNICNIENPANPDFYGKYLVEDAYKNFFTTEYRPKPSYRSAALILRSQNDAKYETVQELEKVGFSHMHSVRAAALCNNDFDRSVTFLQTGQYNHDVKIDIIVDYRSCPLLYFILEVLDAILDLQDHCVMCRKETTLGLKPGVCNKPLCMYQFINEGIGVSLVKEIKRDPFVADLLFSVFAVASRTQYFQPQPQPPEKKTIDQIIKQMPPMERLCAHTDDRSLVDSIGEEMRNILRWVIFTCRSNFLLLPYELEFPQFRSSKPKGKCYQFMALTASPEQEICFQQMKAEYGSRFLWHGSSLDRWHSIIRQGLKNLTGTQYMANGNAHGEGIYFAHNSKTSLGYAKPMENLYNNSKLTKNFYIIALCEVIKLPLNTKTNFTVEIDGSNNKREKKTLTGGLYDHGWCMTLTMNEASIVRFVFVNLDVDVDVSRNPLKDIPTLNKVLKNRAHLNINDTA